jgi:hypothetical protein
MDEDKPTLSKLDKKLLNLSHKFGLEGDGVTRTGNGLLGKLDLVNEKQHELEEILKTLQKDSKALKEVQQNILKILETDNISKTTLKEWFIKTWKFVDSKLRWILLGLGMLGYLSDQKFHWFIHLLNFFAN